MIKKADNKMSILSKGMKPLREETKWSRFVASKKAKSINRHKRSNKLTVE